MFKVRDWNMKGGKPPLIEAISATVLVYPSLKPIQNY
jgi:hypothetical protein